MLNLFTSEQTRIEDRTCKTCKHRQRWGFEYGTKVTQHCSLQADNRNRTGFKTIKAKNPACYRYEEVKND